MSLLEVQGLHKSFGGVVAARDVTFAVEAGRLLAVIGPNGAGKSTLFNMVGGQLRPDRGRVLLAGQDITGMAPRRVWRLGVGRTFQVAQTFVSMTVAENVQMALISRHGRTRAWWPDAAGLHRATHWTFSIASACATTPIGRAASWPMATSSAWSSLSRSPARRSCC